MPSIFLGTKITNFEFHISNVDLDGLKGKDPDYTISKNGDIIISESKSDYVVLSGSFNWSKVMTGDYDAGVKQLTGIAVYEGGKLSYKASGLKMDGAEFESGAIFKQYLADQGYLIKGNNYANEIEAADRNDVINALGGNDTVYGLGGTDRLNGGTGNDRLVGGTGNDTLIGGKGADVFEFVAGDGRDVIIDFQARGKGQDHIDLSFHSQVTSFADLEIRDAGKNVVITVGDDTITLKGVSHHDIGADDFYF